MPTNPTHSARKTAFFHVPKTGGATFRDIMASIYGDQFHFCMDPSLEGVQADLAKYDCLELHMLPHGRDWAYPHTELIRQGRLDMLAACNNFIMFRNPVDHYLSQYYYAVTIRDRMEPIMNRNGLKFPESLEEIIEDPASFNNQTGFVIGKIQLYGNPLTHQDLEDAKKILADLPIHVGLTERFADSMHAFETITGRSTPWQLVRKRNLNTHRPKLLEVPASTRERIRELSALDVELYDFAQELFQKDMTACGPNPGYSFASVSCESETELAEAATSSAKRALSWLVESQLPGGEFQTTILANRREVDGQRVGEPTSFKCPFTSVMVLSSLQSALHLDSRAPAALQRGLLFLKNDMSPGGLWSFWTRDHPKRIITPPDLDDTACVSQLLQAHNIQIPKNHGLFYDTRDKRGAFYLWVYKVNSLRKLLLYLRTGGKAFAHQKKLWYEHRDAICAPVNANCVLYLGDNPQTRGAIDYLLRTFRENREAEETRYYSHPMSLYYMASRALAQGITALAEAKPVMAERIQDLQRLDGGFGDELLTAQAVCSLLNLGLHPPRLADAVAYLLATQRPDGSWKRIPMFGSPPVPIGFGSEDMTTAVCLEALTRYSAASKAS